MGVSAVASESRLIGEGSEREKRAAKDGWNERQPTGAESAKFPGFLEGPLGEARSGAGAKQGQLSSEWEPGSQEHTVVDFLCPPALPTLGWRRRLRGGGTERKVSQAVLPGEGREEPAALLLPLPRVCAAGSEPGRRHSTKKRTSTTSRTAKRTAMAHHWRRSGRQHTGSALPAPYTPQDSYRTGKARPGHRTGKWWERDAPICLGLALGCCCSWPARTPKANLKEVLALCLSLLRSMGCSFLRVAITSLEKVLALVLWVKAHPL